MNVSETKIHMRFTESDFRAHGGVGAFIPEPERKKFMLGMLERAGFRLDEPAEVRESPIDIIFSQVRRA